MIKTSIAVAALGLAIFGAQKQDERSHLRFEEKEMFIEYFAHIDEAVVQVKATSEKRLDRVDVRDPYGNSVLRLSSNERDGRGVASVKVDTLETTLRQLFETYPRGEYDLRGRGVDGRMAFGKVMLSHELLPPPVIVYPLPGAVNVHSSFVAQWVPDADAIRYIIEVEQDDNDGLTAELAPGSSSMIIPPGVLAPNKESHFEVGAVHANGNVTVFEVDFRTM